MALNKSARRFGDTLVSHAARTEPALMSPKRESPVSSFVFSPISPIARPRARMESRFLTPLRAGVAVGGAALLLLYGLAAVPASAGSTAPRARAGSLVALPSLSAQVTAAVNRVRLAHGRRTLTAAAGLEAAALQHSIEMGRDGYFAHDSHDGTAFWKRLHAFYPAPASGCWAVGENLVYAGPDLTAAQAIQLWLHSPEHRRNMLDPQWQQLGVAAVQVTDAGGVFGGQTVTVITNDFAGRC